LFIKDWEQAAVEELMVFSNLSLLPYVVAY